MPDDLFWLGDGGLNVPRSCLSHRLPTHCSWFYKMACSGVHICVLLYICKNPGMDRNYCVIGFIVYMSYSDTQKVAKCRVHEKKIDVQKKGGGGIRGTKYGPVHKYLCSVWSNVIVDCTEKCSKFPLCVLNISTQIEMTMTNLWHLVYH